jgi:hypothetical protein
MRESFAEFVRCGIVVLSISVGAYLRDLSCSAKLDVLRG